MIQAWHILAIFLKPEESQYVYAIRIVFAEDSGAAMLKATTHIHNQFPGVSIWQVVPFEFSDEDTITMVEYARYRGLIQ